MPGLTPDQIQYFWPIDAAVHRYSLLPKDFWPGEKAQSGRFYPLSFTLPFIIPKTSPWKQSRFQNIDPVLYRHVNLACDLHGRQSTTLLFKQYSKQTTPVLPAADSAIETSRVKTFRRIQAVFESVSLVPCEVHVLFRELSLTVFDSGRQYES